MRRERLPYANQGEESTRAHQSHDLERVPPRAGGCGDRPHLSGRHSRRYRRGAASRRRFHHSDGDARRAGARAQRRCARRYRRPGLVGAQGAPARCATRRRPPCNAGCWMAWGWSCSIPATTPRSSRRSMGTTANLKWREANDKERLWVVNPATHRRRHRRVHRAARGGDVRRVLRHPAAGRRSSSSAGSPAARSSAAAAATNAAGARSSISAPATKRTRPITTRTCSG